MSWGRGRKLAVPIVAALLFAVAVFIGAWNSSGPLRKDTSFLVPEGASLTMVARLLEQQGAIDSAEGFRLYARILGKSDPIRAGEFLLPEGASPSDILEILQRGEVVRHFVAIPEGMPSVMVQERLMAVSFLTGEIEVPPEGSVLPDSYDFTRGETRGEVLLRMQAAMRRTLDALWEKRDPDAAVKTREEAVILASIVEKETGKASERRLIAGLYSNRLRQGMLLQADPTIIYPITKGKPLGRRILKSEIQAVNDYNTYAMAGLPKAPITNPGRESLEAVLHPAETDALYMVADGSGGHAFATTLEEHNRNVEKWFAIRKARGEL